MNGMKIDQIVCQVLRSKSIAHKTASCQDLVLVRVRTDEGLEGGANVRTDKYQSKG